MWRSLVLAAAFALLGAESSSAAEVRLRPVPCPEARCSGTELAFEVTDRDGVADDLGLRFVAGMFVVRGTPAPTPGTGCTVTSPGEVRCPVPDGVRLQYRQVALGAGDDRITVGGVGPLSVQAGPGDDVLEADPESVVSWSGGPGADRSDGPRVSVVYFDQTAPVSVTYDGEANDGAAGEGDQVGRAGAGATSGPGSDLLVADGDGAILDGGDGSDALFGGPAADQLYGGPGDDVLRGAAGDDVLSGTDGADDLDGGDGDDRLAVSTATGQPDRVEGGPGADRAFVGVSGPPFTLDLGTPPAAGGPDVVSGVEALELAAGGTVGRLLGGPRSETLSLIGRRGSLLSGGGGDDTLTASTGTITVDAGPGRDRVVARDPTDVLRLRDGKADAAACPFGLRTAPLVDREDVLDGCGAPMVPSLSRVRLRGRLLRVPVACPPVTGQECAGTVQGRLTLRTGPRVPTSRVSLRVGSGSVRVAVLALGPRSARIVRAALRAGRPVQLEVTTSRRLTRQRTPAIASRTAQLT